MTRFRLLVPTMLAAAAILLPAAPAYPWSADIVLDDDFSVTPTTYDAPPGTLVYIGNAGSRTHNMLQDAPLKLWKTGDLTNLEIADVSTDWAGTFKFHCKYHSNMVGKLRTPVDTQFSAMILGASSDVVLGMGDLDAPMKYQAQVRRNEGDWKPFAFTRKASKGFTPTKGGSYEFRSRVVIYESHKITGRSGWSPVDPTYSQTDVIVV